MALKENEVIEICIQPDGVERNMRMLQLASMAETLSMGSSSATNLKPLVTATPQAVQKASEKLNITAILPTALAAPAQTPQSVFKATITTDTNNMIAQDHNAIKRLGTITSVTPYRLGHSRGSKNCKEAEYFESVSRLFEPKPSDLPVVNLPKTPSTASLMSPPERPAVNLPKAPSAALLKSLLAGKPIAGSSISTSKLSNSGAQSSSTPYNDQNQISSKDQSRPPTEIPTAASTPKAIAVRDEIPVSRIFPFHQIPPAPKPSEPGSIPPPVIPLKNLLKRAMTEYTESCYGMTTTQNSRTVSVAADEDLLSFDDDESEKTVDFTF